MLHRQIKGRPLWHPILVNATSCLLLLPPAIIKLCVPNTRLDLLLLPPAIIKLCVPSTRLDLLLLPPAIIRLCILLLQQDVRIAVRAPMCPLAIDVTKGAVEKGQEAEGLHGIAFKPSN